MSDKEFVTKKNNALNEEQIEKAEVSGQQDQTVLNPKKATVKCSYNVALRKKPNKKAAVIKAIKDGTEVEVISKENDYSQVRVDGHVGYIASEFLK